jgi:hypothetical protein
VGEDSLWRMSCVSTQFASQWNTQYAYTETEEGPPEWKRSTLN